MLSVLSVVADVVTIVAVFEVTKRYLKPAWLLSFGCWFNAQYWGPRADVRRASLFLPYGCWSRALPKWLCGAFARILLVKFEKRAMAEEDLAARRAAAKSIRDEIYDKWIGIASRHVRRGWNGHPHHCRRPNPPGWCSNPACHQRGTSQLRRYTTTDHVSIKWYCEEHIGDTRTLGDPSDGQPSSTRECAGLLRR